MQFKLGNGHDLVRFRHKDSLVMLRERSWFGYSNKNVVIVVKQSLIKDTMLVTSLTWETNSSYLCDSPLFCQSIHPPWPLLALLLHILQHLTFAFALVIITLVT